VRSALLRAGQNRRPDVSQLEFPGPCVRLPQRWLQSLCTTVIIWVVAVGHGVMQHDDEHIIFLEGFYRDQPLLAENPGALTTRTGPWSFIADAELFS